MASQPQWIPPLPAGFEARWDPNQRAYFFINHVTRQTTWVDPRFTQQPNQQTQHAAAAQQHPHPQRTPQKSLNPASMHATGGQGQNVAMGTMFKQFGSTTTRDSGSSDDADDEDWEDPAEFDKLFASATDEPAKVDLMKLQEIKQAFPTAPEDVIRSLLIKHNNGVIQTTNDLFNKGHRRVAVKHPPPKMSDMLERLRAMFPEANPGLVEDMLSASQNDEKNARQLLEEMGYKPTFPATHRNKSAQRQRTPSPVKPKPRSPSPVKKQVSESEKQSRLRQLQNEMPSTEKTVIEMALQVCNYDVERTKNVLERMTTNDDSSRPGTSATSRPTTSSSSRRSPSPTPVLSPASLSLDPSSLDPASLDPFSLFSDDTSSHTHTSSGTHSSGTHSSSGTSSRPSTSGPKKSSTGSRSSGTTGSSSSRPSTGSKTRTPSPRKQTPSHQKQQRRAKQVTEMSKDILSSTIATLNRIGNNVGCCGQPSNSDDTESSSTVTKETEESSQSATDQTSHSQSETGTQSHDSHDDDKSTNESSSSGTSIVSRQPQSREVYVSENRTQAQGPNPALRAGPNRNLLLDQYSLARGPNAELRQGPDSSRVAGSQGAAGPDRSLQCGPQLTLSEGPSRSTENLLVTAI